MLKTIRKNRRAPGILALALLALLPLLAVQCTVKKPVAPSWSTTLNIPLVSRIMDMRYIVSKDTTHLSIVGDTVMLAMGKPLNPVRVGDNLKFNANLSTNLNLKNIILTNQTTIDTSDHTSIVQFYRNLWQLGYIPAADTLWTGYTGPVVGVPNLANYKLAKLAYHQFGYMRVDSMTMLLSFHNEFPFTMRDVWITLKNCVSGDTLTQLSDSVYIGDVNGFSTSPQVPVRIYNKYVADTIQPYLRCNVVGGNPVNVNGNSQFIHLHYGLGPGKISIVIGTVIADSQTVEGADTLNQGNTRIKTCSFASGTINLSLVNNLIRTNGSSVTGTVQYSLPQFRHRTTGLPLSGSYTMSGNTATISRDVSQYQFVSDTLFGGDTIATKKLKYHFLFAPDPSPFMIQISATSYINGSFTFNPQLVIDRFEGVLDTLRANIPALTQNLNMNAAADSMHVTFTHPEMRLNLSSSFSNIKGRFHLEFRGYTRTGSLIPVSLVLEDTLHYNNYALPSLFRDNNAGGAPTNLATFLSYFPNVIESDITNSFFYIQTASSSGNSVSRVSRADSVTGSFTFETPFYITMQASGMYPNPDSVGIGKNDNLQFISGGISYEFRNHLPLGIDSIIVYAGTRKSLVDSCRRYGIADTGVVRIGTISMPAAPVGSDGLTSGEAPLARGTISLSQRQLDLFRNTTDDKKYVFLAAKIRLPGTGGSQVLVRGSDYINMKVLATINTMIINK